MFSKFSNKIKFEHLNMEFPGKYPEKQKSRSRVNTLRDFQKTCCNKSLNQIKLTATNVTGIPGAWSDASQTEARRFSIKPRLIRLRASGVIPKNEAMWC